MVTRGGRYLFHIVEEIEKRGMPAELALLPFIESAFNPQALSRTRASGMWQFMPATGKDFELRQNVFRDDRRDVLASTRAALDYLQRLHGLFGDWHLALAAYNWGQGNVQRALDRNRRAGLPQDYMSLRMPDETRDYVPKLQAIKNIVSAPERLGLALPPLENHPYFVGVPVDRDMDVALAARLAHLPLDDFLALNPQLDKPVILAAGTPQVLLPYDNANLFIRELALVRGPLASWTAWVAPKSLKPAEAAKLVGMPEALLREVNRIPPRMVVKAGSTLLVPRAAHATEDVTGHMADHANLLLAPEGRPLRKLAFKAGKNGDTVAAVAKRYRVSAAQVALWNSVAVNARFKAGQSITVMAAAPAPARKLAQAGARSSSKTRGAKANGAKTAQRPVSTAGTARAVGTAGKGSKPAHRVRVAQAH
jgi:membrane-bound lytic murein transglycosylase D